MPATAANKIVRDLFSLVQFLREQVKAEHGAFALSIVHFQALSYIYNTKNPLMREVAHFLAVTPPSATSLVNTLIRHKLVSRVVDPQDRRIVRLKLTRIGNHLLADRFGIVSRALAKKMSVLSKTEQTTFSRLLNSLINP